MELTEKQKQGLELAIEKYNTGKQYIVISGFAGTGKSTLVRFIIDALKVNESRVVYTAPTGKACSVLKEKGNKNVETIHHLLYEHFPQPDGTFKRIKRDNLGYTIIVVDECSMVDKDMIDLLLSHFNIFAIFLGDPFQLPAIGEGNDLLDNPDVFLDEVMRQALDNEIIKFSMDIRNGEPLPTEYKGKNVQIYSKEKLTTGMLKWGDQILCATNKTRYGINNQMRELKGLSGQPQVGDKVICLKNDWDLADEDGDYLINGTIGTIVNIDEGYYPVLKKMKIKDNKIPYYTIDLETENGTHFYNLKIDKQLFEKDIPYLTDQQKYMVSKNVYLKKMGIEVPHEFTYAYGITTHKAQGSAWRNILIIEENFPFDSIEHRRWLYTAITRSSNKVVIIRR